MISFKLCHWYNLDYWTGILIYLGYIYFNSHSQNTNILKEKINSSHKKPSIKSKLTDLKCVYFKLSILFVLLHLVPLSIFCTFGIFKLTFSPVSSSVTVSPDVLTLCPMVVLNQLFHSLCLSFLVSRRLPCTLFQTLRSLSIAAAPTTRRGTRGGKCVRIKRATARFLYCGLANARSLVSNKHLFNYHLTLTGLDL